MVKKWGPQHTGTVAPRAMSFIGTPVMNKSDQRSMRALSPRAAVEPHERAIARSRNATKTFRGPEKDLRK